MNYRVYFEVIKGQEFIFIPNESDTRHEIQAIFLMLDYDEYSVIKGAWQWEKSIGFWI